MPVSREYVNLAVEALGHQRSPFLPPRITERVSFAATSEAILSTIWSTFRTRSLARARRFCSRQAWPTKLMNVMRLQRIGADRTWRLIGQSCRNIRTRTRRGFCARKDSKLQGQRWSESGQRRCCRLEMVLQSVFPSALMAEVAPYMAWLVNTARESDRW